MIIIHLDQNNISFIRNVVDKIAAGKNISSESLIADSANNKVLKNSFEEIGKSFKYVTNVGYTDLNTATSVLNSLFS